MADDTQQEDRTEAATPRRLQRAREEGRVPVSREIQGLAGLAAVALTLAYAGDDVFRDLTLRLAGFIAHADADNLAGAAGLRLAVRAFVAGAAPFAFATLLAGAAAALVQTGFLISGAALRPNVSRISPRAGLRRLLGPDNLIESLKSVAKIGVLGIAVWGVLRAELPALRQASHWDLHLLLPRTLHAALRVVLVVLAVQLVIAVLDVLWVRLRHGSQLRMSKQDVRDDQKETEGDPRIRARIRQIRTQRARRRMLAAVPRATVVITNPTHYAVALRYDRGRNDAPRVVAKGVDSLAARIREVARAHGVPLVVNPPLAQALHRVELDREIPAEYYQAVAEIIAYVWRLGRRAPVREFAG